MEPDKVTTSAVIQDLMCARQQKKMQFMSQTIDVFFKKKKKTTYQQLPFVYVHRSANIQFMFMLTNKTRKEWVLKTCAPW